MGGGGGVGAGDVSAVGVVARSSKQPKPSWPADKLGPATQSGSSGDIDASTPPATKTVTPNSKSAAAATTAKSQRDSEEKGDSELKEKLAEMEKSVQCMREEREKMKLEINGLRDKLEEEAWAKNRLEARVTELADRLKEVEDKAVEGGGGGGAQPEYKSKFGRKEKRKSRRRKIEWKPELN